MGLKPAGHSAFLNPGLKPVAIQPTYVNALNRISLLFKGRNMCYLPANPKYDESQVLLRRKRLISANKRVIANFRPVRDEMEIPVLLSSAGPVHEPVFSIHITQVHIFSNVRPSCFSEFRKTDCPLLQIDRHYIIPYFSPP